MNATPFGFRILGSCHEERRLVNHADAFAAYASLDPRAVVEREAYLSAFTFGADFRALLESTGSCRGFDGACWSAWLWFDLDAADLDAALRDARRLSLWLMERYQLDDDRLLIFFSGSKGFHVGLPSALWGPESSATFHRGCRKLAEGIAGAAAVNIDTGVYDRVRAFRAPNSRHPKTGLHKRRLTLDELTGLTLDGIRQLAEKPAAFDLPDAPPVCERGRADWLDAARLVEQGEQAKAKALTSGKGPALNRATLAFIRDGADNGDRHRLLYSAARNLGEFGCPPALAHALLSEAALDCGLAPKEVHRQIECGLQDQAPVAVERIPTPAPSPDLSAQLAALWQGPAPAAADEPKYAGDAWEHPQDRLGVVDRGALAFPFGANGDGPYAKEGGRL